MPKHGLLTMISTLPLHLSICWHTTVVMVNYAVTTGNYNHDGNDLSVDTNEATQ